MKLPIILIFVVSANILLACSCDAPSNLLKAFNTSDLVMHAKVTNISTIPLEKAFKANAFEHSNMVRSPFNDQQQHIQKVELEVVKTFKGEANNRVTVFTALSDMVCGYTGFGKGEEYIIYGMQSCFMTDVDLKYALPNTYWTNQCSRTKLFSQLEVNEIEKLLTAKETFYFSGFNKIDFQELLEYMDNNEMEMSWEVNNDLLAATQFNQYLSDIEYEENLDVGFFMEEEGIGQIRFYFKDKSTSRISTQESPIRIYYQNADDKPVFQAVIYQSYGKELKITYTHKKRRIIVSHWLDQQLNGYYTEYDIHGMSRTEGKYEQIDSEPHKIDLSSSPDIFAAKSADLLVTKKPVKVGTWRYFDEEGELVKVQKF